MYLKLIKIFLRFSVSISFLSAVADRLGFWNVEISVWGNWNSFLEYTQLINPWITSTLISPIGTIVTIAEVVLSFFLLIGFKTELVAKLSGILLLAFAISMTASTGIKGVLDYSVLTAASGAFALSMLKKKYFEIDLLIQKYMN